MFLKKNNVYANLCTIKRRKIHFAACVDMRVD